MSCLLNEPYSLPQIFTVRGQVRRLSQSENELSAVDSSDCETHKAVDKALTCELAVTSEQPKESAASDPMKLLREKMYAIQRNTNKKLVRRDKAILEQAEQIDKQKVELDKLQRKFTQMESRIQLLKRDKERFRHKAVYWRTRTNETRSSSEDREVELVADKQEETDVLRQDLQDIEDENIELQDKLSELSTDEIIKTFHKGRFTDDVRICCPDLLSLNVGIRNVEPVIRSVMKNLVHQSIGRLPSHTALCRMMLEGLSISEMQL